MQRQVQAIADQWNDELSRADIHDLAAIVKDVVQEIDTTKNSATIDKPSSGDAAKTDDKSAETADTVKA